MTKKFWVKLITSMLTISVIGILTFLVTTNIGVSAASSNEIIVHYYYTGSKSPYVYYWNSLPENMEVEWPGEQMEAESYGNWYTFKFSGKTKVNLIFNDGGAEGTNQTEDLTRNSGEWWYKDGKWTSTNPDIFVQSSGDFREESIYFLMTARFYDGDESNNVHCVEDQKAGNGDGDPAWRGDFKGLIEKLDYIKAMGFSALWITPIVENGSSYDFHGYHALNFNKVDPRLESEGATYQDLIKACHDKDIKIIQDVVFNHTYTFADSIYNKIVPNYFYLMDRNGNLSNGSFCGDDIDTSKKMTHKYFVDMCLRYVKLLQIDGLRFDLMGILTKDLVIDIYNKCKEVNPSFIMYGEGWNMPSMLPEHQRASIYNANQIPNIAFFNDFFRDIVSGKCYNNFSHSKGYINGNTDLYYDFVKAMRGTVEKGCYFQNASSSINYCECHDNFTLYDKLKITNSANSEEQRNKIQLCCIASILLAEGVPFLHMGVEFNRTKFGVENSYNASDEINMIRWENIDKYEKNIKAVKDFIKIRKEFNCFKEYQRKTILNTVDARMFGSLLAIMYAFKGKIALLLFNPTNKKQKATLANEYKLYANINGLVNKDDKTYQNVSVNPYEFLMLIK